MGDRRALHHSVFAALSLPGVFMSRTLIRNAYSSANSSMIFAVGLPAPWPAFVSMRASTGAVAGLAVLQHRR